MTLRVWDCSLHLVHFRLLAEADFFDQKSFLGERSKEGGVV